MKKYTTIIFVFLLILFAIDGMAQPGCPNVNAGPDVTLSCGTPCTNLTATCLATGNTNTYTVGTIPYNPPYPYNTGTPILVNIDDTWSSVITLPFSFCFYGNIYSQIICGSNGVVSFDLTSASGYCPWSFSSACPSSSLPTNSIFGVYHDIDPGVSGTMYYAILGAYPCRTFVVNWNQVAMFSGSCNSLLATHQIVMYESTNVIEVYVQNKPLCSSWNGGNALIGIQNSSGTIGIAPPGRNTGQWTAQNEAWRFTPAGPPNYTLTWWQGTTQIGTGATINVCPTATTTYTAQVIYDVCVGNDVIVTDNVVVNIAPNSAISVTPSNSTICNSQSVTLTASGGNNFTWAPSTGLSSTTGASVTATPSVTTTYTVSGVTPSGCTATATALITVNTYSPVTASASPTAICNGQSSTLTGSSSNTYVWMPGNLSGTSVSVTPNITTIYTVTGTTLAGCTGSSTLSVTVNQNPILNASASPPAICMGNNSTLTVASSDPSTTFSWLPGNQTSNSISVSPLATTVYSVAGTSIAGCTGSTTVNLTINPNPQLSAQASPTAVCTGFSSSLTASSSVQGATYEWMPGTLTGSPVTVTPTNTTTYTVTGTVSGCTGTTTVTVTLLPNPVVAAVASPPNICIGDSSFLSGNGASTYLWLPGNVNGQNIAVTPIVTTTYTATGTSVDGCTGTAQVTVSIDPNPTINLSASPPYVCIGDSSILTANGAVSFVWEPGTYAGNNYNVAPTSTTNYTVLGISVNGCTGTAMLSLPVYLNPTIAAIATPPTICEGSTTILTGSGGVNYNWLPNNLTGNNVSVSPSVTTTYTVLGTDSFGCTGTSTLIISTVPVPPLNILSQPEEGCSPLSVDFQYNTLATLIDSTWSWNFGDASNQGNPTTAVAPTHLFTSGGTYIVSFSGITAENCPVHGSDTIIVIPTPIADFIYTPEYVFSDESDVHFNNQSTYANSWQWDFGDYYNITNNFSSMMNPIHVYSDTGYFPIQLIASNKDCHDTLIKWVHVFLGDLVFVPNAFTPNQDGKNEIFKPSTLGIDESEYLFVIYDRWGKSVFGTTSPDMGWDGLVNGTKCEGGVYVYTVRYKEIMGVKRQIYGVVTLVR